MDLTKNNQDYFNKLALLITVNLDSVSIIPSVSSKTIPQGWARRFIKTFESLWF